MGQTHRVPLIIVGAVEASVGANLWTTNDLKFRLKQPSKCDVQRPQPPLRAAFLPTKPGSAWRGERGSRPLPSAPKAPPPDLGDPGNCPDIHATPSKVGLRRPRGSVNRKQRYFTESGCTSWPPDADTERATKSRTPGGSPRLDRRPWGFNVGAWVTLRCRQSSPNSTHANF